MNAIQPGEHLLDQELGLAVGVGGEQARIFLNRNGFRLAVDGGGGGEDQAAGTVGEHGLKQGKRRGGVVAEEDLGAHHRLAGFNEGGKVEDAVERSSHIVGCDKEVFKREPVSDFALHKLDTWGEQVAPAMAQIVKNHRLVSLFGKQSRNCPANVSGAAGNQYLHKKDCPFLNGLGTLESITIGRGLKDRSHPAKRPPGPADRGPELLCHFWILPACINSGTQFRKAGSEQAAGKIGRARFFGSLGWKVEIQNVRGL